MRHGGVGVWISDLGVWSIRGGNLGLRSIRGGGEVGFCSIRGGGVGHCKLAIVTGVPLRGVTCEAVSPSSSSISSSVPSESASHSSESSLLGGLQNICNK